MTNAAVTAIDLTKRYGTFTALDTLNLQIPRGEVFGLVGPNGAGKTTTMRLLLDLVRPTSGTVRVLGTQPREGGGALRRRIGYLPGELRLAGRVTARNLLQHYASVSGPVVEGVIDALAERLGLDLTREVRKLSKGNKQKVGLVQAFMHKPDLLVLDEPTSGLDPLVQQQFLDLVREAQAAGQTVLLSSHVLSEIEKVADRVGVLHRGRLVEVGEEGALRFSRRRQVRAVVRAAPEAVIDALGALGIGLGVTAQGEEVRVVGALEDGVDALVKTLARFEVIDLVISEPQLEEAILDLYRDEEVAGE
ncbi:MAG: ABC transporter ATP-binding protein [Trueperaceae bacterium]|nr:ABC transporter ATP-binding protein [Trueperaceae bacterium]